MKISQYLDATYLKTASQANLSEAQNQQKVINLVKEAMLYNYKLIMIRANYIPLVKGLLLKDNKNILIGTVISFPKGNNSIKEKLEEAKKAIALGANELDFVINYNAFKSGNLDLIKKEVTNCTKLCLSCNKKVKWIIETAALTEVEIVVISQLIKNIIFSNFGRETADRVFIKSSTGFFKTENNLPNGATLEIMKLIVENAKPLKIKAAGGVKDYKTAVKMITLGVDRIGTSSSKAIVNRAQSSKSKY